MPFGTSRSKQPLGPETGHFRKQCPFYGFRWKENSDRLFDQGNNECGLEFDKHGQCVVELAGEMVDYIQCPLARHYQSFLECAVRFIRFCPSRPISSADENGIPIERRRGQAMRRVG